MKQLFLMISLNLLMHTAEAQIGLGVTTPHPNAYFEVSSSNKGVLLPRMTAVQRIAIAPAAAAAGLLVYDTDSTAFMYWNGTAWNKINYSNGGELWKQNGSHIYNGNSGNVGIGTPFFIAPAAKLHVLSGSVLFNKDFPAESSPANPPLSGQGRRLMWYAEKAATRAGYVSSTAWDKDSIGNYSFATGGDTKAKGEYAFASGHQSNSSGQYATAMGWNNAASGQGATAVGALNTASGAFGATATGFNNISSGNASFTTGTSGVASGDISFAAGSNCVASGSGSFVAGFSSLASGQYAVAMGNGVAASGGSAVAFGASNAANGFYSFTANWSNIASGTSATAFGNGNTAKAPGGFVIGAYNNDTDSPNPNIAAPTDRLFQVGNGFVDAFGSAFRQNAFTIQRNGHVGIGVTDPISPLSFSNNTGQKITLWGTDNNNSYGIGLQGSLLQIHSAYDVDNIAFGYGSSTNFTERMRIKGNGHVGIGNSNPDFLLDVSNRIRIRSGGDLSNSAGIWLNNSDNSSYQAFIGNETDNTVGFYGLNSGWNFTMNTTTGKIKIADGTQGAGRVLTSDANGEASWVATNANKSGINALLPGFGINLQSEVGSYYTNLFIDLPPGKWLVIGTYLLAQGGVALTQGQSAFVRTSFSSSNFTNTNTGDIIGSGLMSGHLSYPTPYAVMSGQNIVNNTSGATKRYYVWANIEKTGSPDPGFFVSNLCGNFWQENNLVAIPMN